MTRFAIRPLGLMLLVPALGALGALVGLPGCGSESATDAGDAATPAGGAGGGGTGGGTGGERIGHQDVPAAPGGTTADARVTPVDGGGPPADLPGPDNDARPGDGGGPPTCGEGLTWTPGTAIFREVTAEWGITDVGAQGTRLNVLDFDGDGRPDLFVRKSDDAENFAPDGTRGKWLLRNTGDGHFEDVTRASGLLNRRFPVDGQPDLGRPVSVVAAADADNDGDVDVFLAAPVGTNDAPAGTETSELMLNRGDGTFELGPAGSAARQEGQAAVPAGITFTDANRDGVADLWMPQNMPPDAWQPLPPRFFVGDGQGGFTDMTTQAALGTKDWELLGDMNLGFCHPLAWSGTACDLNNDGAPELMASSYGRFPNSLFQGRWNRRAIRYSNRAVSSGYGYDQRIDWTDNESARCWCHLHPDAEDCAGVPAPQRIRCNTDADAFRWNHSTDRELYRLGGNNGATVCADVNNDGHLDLLTTTIVHWDVGSSSDPAELLINTGEENVRFERPGNEVTGLTRERPESAWNDGDMTGAILDFDFDGWPDVYIGSSDYPGDRGLLWHQRPDEPVRFDTVETTDFFEHNRSHGVVVADFDGDGDSDLAVGHSFARCDANAHNNCYETQSIRVFENLLGNRNAWLQLELEGGPGTNRSAVGARVSVTAGGVTQTQEVGGGHGHFGTQNELTLSFGLASACEADVTIRWPDEGLTTTTHHLTTRHRYHVLQGQDPAVVGE